MKVWLNFVVAGWIFLTAAGILIAGNPDFDLGWQQYQDNDWAGAVTNFSKSIVATNDLYDSYCYRAYARAQLNDSNGAIADCSEVIKLDATSGYYWRASVEELMTNIDGALADYQAGMKTNPAGKPEKLVSDLCADLTTEAYKKFGTGDVPGALTNVELVISLSPTNRQWALYFCGYLEMRLGQYDSAVTNENLVLKYWPDDLFAMSARAWARYGLNDIPGATADSQQVIGTIHSAMPVQTDPELGDPVKSDPVRYPILLEMEGLQSLIKGDYQQAYTAWTDFLSTNSPMSAADKEYYQGWIERAKGRAGAK